ERIALLLAVVADVDAGIALLAYGHPHRFASDAINFGRIDRVAPRARGVEPGQVARARQAAGMRRQYPRGAALHRFRLLSRHMVRQAKGEIGPQYDQRKHHEHGQMERNGADNYLAQFAVPDALYNEQIDSDRR